MGGRPLPSPGLPAAARLLLALIVEVELVPGAALQLGGVDDVLQLRPPLFVLVGLDSRHAEFAERGGDRGRRELLLEYGKGMLPFRRDVVQGQLQRLLAKHLLQVLRDHLRGGPPGLVDLEVEPHPVRQFGRQQGRRQVAPFQGPTRSRLVFRAGKGVCRAT